MMTTARVSKVKVLGLAAALAATLTGAARARQDETKTARSGSTSPAATAPARPAAVPAAVIGSIDMEAIFKSYDKVKDSGEKLKADVMAKQGELAAGAKKMEALLKKREQFALGTPDAKAVEAELTKLKVQLDSDKEQAQQEFSARDAEALAGLYKDIQGMVAEVAQNRKMTYVVRVSTEPVVASDPNSVMSAMARAVVFADPSTDITKTVVYNLNLRYKGTAEGKASAAASAAVSSAKRAAPKAN